MRTHLILQHLYRIPARARRRNLARWVWRRLVDRVERNVTGVTIGSLIFGILVVSHIYYFNILLDLESNVDTARAQIDVAKEKRNHVLRTQTQLLRFHAGYEKELLKDVTKLRSSGRASKPFPSEGLRIDAVGEEYPQLLVNTTVHDVSQALIAAEADVAKRIADYNDAVNVYTNVLHQFPGNIIGPLLGYQNRDYFTPEDPAALPYHEVTP